MQIFIVIIIFAVAENLSFQGSSGDDSLDSIEVFHTSSGDQDSSSFPYSSSEEPLVYQQYPTYSIYQDPSIVHASGDFIMANQQLVNSPVYDQSLPAPFIQQQQYYQQPTMATFAMPHGVNPLTLQQFESGNYLQPAFDLPLPYPVLQPGTASCFSQDVPIYQQPAMTVSPHFLLQSCDEESCYFTENSLWGISGYISFSHSEFGFSHPLGQVYKTQRVLLCNFALSSGITWYTTL